MSAIITDQTPRSATNLTETISNFESRNLAKKMTKNESCGIGESRGR